MNPILILIGLGALAALIISAKEEPENSETEQPTPDGKSDFPDAEEDTAEAVFPVSQPITLEILREIFQDGARPLRRSDAVEMLKAAPYFIPKTNAYRALAPARRFAAHLWEDENGWLHFTA